jgi:hypothetical protein
MAFQSNSNLYRKIWIPVLSGAIALSAVVGPVGTAWPFAKPPIAAAATVTYKLVKQSETIVTSGARQIDYRWVPSDSTKSTELVHVLAIDLTNPYVQLNALGGKNGSVTARQSVGAMAKETGAVAGINGDVFNTSSGSEGAPLGAQITSGQLVTSTSKLIGMYAFGVTKDKKPIIDQFAFSGTVYAGDGSSFPLTGINKSAYRTEPDNGYSHVNALYMYTSAWTGEERPKNSGTTPTEALVVDGVVQEVAVDRAIATPIPANGYILRGHKDAAEFIKKSLTVGQKVTVTSSLTSLTNGKSYDPTTFQMMVSGHTILVDGGKAAPFSRDISGLSGNADRARTAVGYSADGKTVYLVTVEENGSRKGVTLSELQQILIQLGAYKAVNLDGGGSTTMVSRPLGEFDVKLTHPTSYGTTQRLVANGIGVFTLAPKGSVKGIVASGAKTLFIGQQATYALKAYDTYYNPIDPGGLTPVWSASGGVGTFNGGVFTASKPGDGTITVKAGSASNSIGIHVVGGGEINRLTASPSTTVLANGATISVPVKAQLADGSEVTVPASSLKWEFRGFAANAAGGNITVQSVGKDTKIGYAIARYDGFSTVVPLAVGAEKTLENFENVAYSIGFSGLPAETQGTASLVTGMAGRESSQVLDLKYDFTNGTGDRFAYAVLNGGAGITVDGNPSTLSLDVLGDNSYNWLRAEFLNASGKQVYVTLASKIDWTGWKTLKVDLASAGLTYPAKLTKLYVVNLAKDQDERALQGEVAFDDLKLQTAAGTSSGSAASVKLTLNSKQATVNGKAVTLDTAPIAIDGATYLPLRFVSESLGGSVDWEATLKRVTVLRGDRMLELWPGKPDLIANGVRIATTTSPIIRNGRVLVPIRVVSEQLGQKVDWNAADKSITIR